MSIETDEQTQWLLFKCTAVVKVNIQNTYVAAKYFHHLFFEIIGGCIQGMNYGVGNRSRISSSNAVNLFSIISNCVSSAPKRLAIAVLKTISILSHCYIPTSFALFYLSFSRSTLSVKIDSAMLFTTACSEV